VHFVGLHYIINWRCFSSAMTVCKTDAVSKQTGHISYRPHTISTHGRDSPVGWYQGDHACEIGQYRNIMHVHSHV